jgi:3-deoxy-7-phosphoheptulonate synthase
VLTAFRGDNVNSFDTSARTPDPARMLAGYFHSAATLNYARTLMSTGVLVAAVAVVWACFYPFTAVCSRCRASKCAGRG